MYSGWDRNPIADEETRPSATAYRPTWLAKKKLGGFMGEGVRDTPVRPHARGDDDDERKSHRQLARKEGRKAMGHRLAVDPYRKRNAARLPLSLMYYPLAARRRAGRRRAMGSSVIGLCGA
jgi:hypothetical protein